MSRGSYTLLTMLCLAGSSASAQNATGPTDDQIAHFVYTAGQADIAAADLARKTTHSNAVRAFAGRSISGNTAVSQASQDLLGQLNVMPGGSEISDSVAAVAAEKRQDLSKLSGADFDTAYARNELAFWLTVNGALETTLIPSTRNAEVRSLLEPSLQCFKEYQQLAEQLVNGLQSPA